MNSVTAFAPATVSNVACGFDVLGFPLQVAGDEVTATLAPAGVRIAGCKMGRWTHCVPARFECRMEFLYLIGLVALWVILMKWVLPRFQVNGCRSALCSPEHPAPAGSRPAPPCSCGHRH